MFGTSRRCLVGLLLALAVGDRGWAIEINFQIDNPQNFPSYDPDGSKLKAISTVAASIWERLRPGNDVYNWKIHWEDFESDKVAVANEFDGSIRVKVKDVSWFFDPTPLDNSEFEPMRTVLYQNLTAQQQSSWFPDSDPPDQMEVGYWAPAAAGSSAAGKTDLLTIMLHEMGHLSGIGKNIFKPDVPIPSNWVGGADVKVSRGGDESHIAVEMALMDDNAEGRHLPSALDVMVNASSKGSSAVHLDRVYFIGAGTWGNTLNWLGGASPASNQLAILQSGTAATVTLPAKAQTLLIQDPLSGVGQTTLTVNSLLELTDSIQNLAEMTVGGAGQVKLVSRFINDGTIGDGELTMQSGSQLSANRFDNKPGARILGAGTITTTNTLTNDGDIHAQGGLLYFSSTPGVQMDLDGLNDIGDVSAQEGDIKFTAGSFADFHGDMAIKEGHYIEFADQLKCVDGGELRFENGPVSGALAELRQGPFQTHLSFDGGKLQVDGNTNAKVNAGSVEFRGDQALKVDPSGVLRLQTPSTTYFTGNQQGKGTVIQNGAMYIKGQVQLQFERYDWDGDGEAGWVDLAENSRLSLKVNQTDADQTFDGTITLRANSELNVQPVDLLVSSWRLDGTMELYQGADVTGSTMLVNSGVIHSRDQASNIIKSPLQTEFGSSVQLGKQSQVHLQGNVILGGGTLGSSSTIKYHSKLITSAPIKVTEDTTIFAGHFDWDGLSGTQTTTEIAPQRRLIIRAGEIGDTTNPLFGGGQEGFSDTVTLNDGQLDVLIGTDVPDGLVYQARWSLNPSGRMNLNHVHNNLPTVKGSYLMNKGLITGEGRFENTLGNQGTIEVGHAGELGFVEVTDGFRQFSQGTLVFDLATLQPKLGYDQLISTQQVMLDGTVRVGLQNGFQPKVGDTFRIIDATGGGQVSGSFSQREMPFGQWEVIYGSNYVDVRLAGLDPDADYDMDSADLMILLANWTGADYSGDPLSWSDGDLDGDGDVDSQDLIDLLEQWTGAEGAERAWGLAAPLLEGSQPSTATVPEPTGWGSVVGGLWGMVSLVRRRRVAV
ncbi:MAG: hypothetical protein U0795_20850 [Pirellulales bacterium]